MIMEIHHKIHSKIHSKNSHGRVGEIFTDFFCRVGSVKSTVSNTELSVFFGPHRIPGRELSEFLSAYTEFAPKLSEAQ